MAINVKNKGVFRILRPLWPEINMGNTRILRPFWRKSVEKQTSLSIYKAENVKNSVVFFDFYGPQT